MAAVEESIVIKAPVEAVFNYMKDPAHQSEISSGAARLEDVERFDDGSIRSRFVYNIAGMEFGGRLETIDYQPYDQIAFKLSGKLDGTIWWQFEAMGEQRSRMTYRADYEIAVPLLGGAIAEVAAQFNRQEVETELSNLKRILEVG